MSHREQFLSILAEAIGTKAGQMPVVTEFDRFSQPTVPSVRVVVGDVQHDAATGEITAQDVKIALYRPKPPTEAELMRAKAGPGRHLVGRYALTGDRERDPLGLHRKPLAGLGGSSGHITTAWKRASRGLAARPVSSLDGYPKHSEMAGGVEAFAYSIDGMSVLPALPELRQTDVQALGEVIRTRPQVWLGHHPHWRASVVLNGIEARGDGEYLAEVVVVLNDNSPMGREGQRDAALSAIQGLAGTSHVGVGRIAAVEAEPSGQIHFARIGDGVRTGGQPVAKALVKVTAEHASVDAEIGS